MQINVTFNDYEEMTSFCQRVTAGEPIASTAPKRTKKAEPVMENPAPAETVAAPAEETPAPVEEKPSEITIEAVREKLAGLQKAGKRDEVKALIKSFGAKSLTELPASEYPELMKKAEEL